MIEVSTASSMPPSLAHYYLAIDPKTNRAVPKRIFRVGRGLTNEIHSAMLLSEPQNLRLPKDAGELKIISNGRLAPAFSVYEESERGRIDDNGRRLRRTVYRWNGRFYQVK